MESHLSPLNHIRNKASPVAVALHRLRDTTDSHPTLSREGKVCEMLNEHNLLIQDVARNLNRQHRYLDTASSRTSSIVCRPLPISWRAQGLLTLLRVEANIR